MHTHDFSKVLFWTENEYKSKDEVCHCSCGAVLHRYTWTPGNIEHNTIYDPPKVK